MRLLNFFSSVSEKSMNYGTSKRLDLVYLNDAVIIAIPLELSDIVAIILIFRLIQSPGNSFFQTSFANLVILTRFSFHLHISFINHFRSLD